MRGSVGGITYTANQFHQIVARARTAPVNPATSQQTIIRSAFSAAAQAWKEATDAERISWNTYAHSCIFTGPLGDYTIPGRSIMMAGWTSAMYLDETDLVTNTPQDSPPIQSGFANLGVVKAIAPVTPSSTGFGISIGNPNPQDLGCLINVSLGFHPSRNFYKGPWDLSLLAGLSVSPTTTGTIEITGLETDLKYFFRVKGVEIDAPHRITTEFFGSAIAEDVGP
jgi:hypothetical protein